MDDKKPKNQSLSSGISGDVKSVDGKILSGARVSCKGVETRTLADGTFAIYNLEPGTYDVTISLQGYDSLRTSVSIQEGDMTKSSFCLPKSVGTARIYGHIYDTGSKEIVKKNGSIILVKPIVNKYVQIDKDGHYEFRNLPTGIYRILTSIPQYETGSVTIEVNDGEAKRHDFIIKSLDVEEPFWG